MLKQSKVALVLIGVLAGLSGSIQAEYFRDISEIGTSAAMIGIGNVSGFTKSAAVVFESPTGLAYAGNSLSTFYTTYFGGDTTYMTGAVSIKPRADITLGFGVVYEGVGGIDATATNNSNEAISVGTFAYSSAQYVAGMNYQRDNLNIGISVTDYARTLATLTGNGFDFGVGIRYTSAVGDWQLFGRNVLGNKVLYSNGAQEGLASEWGVGYKSNSFPLMNGDLYLQLKRSSAVARVMPGMGLKVYPLESKLVGLSLGYKEIPKTSTTTRGSVTIGLSLDLQPVIVEYCYDTTDAFQQESQHYISFSMKY
ncbi:MAG: hypothetical protein AB7F28_03595 [Candidatus Margulisiibacteriota bacterium]